MLMNPFTRTPAKIAVIGLGYVGLPLAVAFAAANDVVGFDLKPQRLAELRAGEDSTLEVSAGELAAATRLKLSGDPEDLKSCNVFIVTVPTPIDAAKRPDLSALMAASRTVGGAIGRLISLALRAGADPQAIIKQLIGIRCDKPYGLGPDRVLSCSDAIAKSLAENLASKAPAMDPQAKPFAMLLDHRTGKVTFPCPDCGCELKFEEGCEKCGVCGYSRCS